MVLQATLDAVAARQVIVTQPPSASSAGPSLTDETRSAVASIRRRPRLMELSAPAASALAGAGIGIALSSGLLEVQRIAGPADAAGLTGVFYAFAYAGFLAPTITAATTPPFTTVQQFTALTILGLLSHSGRAGELPQAPTGRGHQILCQRPVENPQRRPDNSPLTARYFSPSAAI
jgi:hypothetical protein